VTWFRADQRDLPWRKTRDPYAIWVSEVMLQQTQVATVVGYFERFLTRFPCVEKLAAADEGEVLRLWEGLGYYRRARQLHAAAKQVVAEHGGEFPTALDEVQGLPGIGRYTAGAILSIALDQRQPILEANTIRLVSRLVGYEGATTSAEGQRVLWQAVESWLPRQKCGEFNQALMELGSLICTPKEPACERCPVAGWCRARQMGAQQRIPQPKARLVREDVQEVALVVRQRGNVLMWQRGAGERWEGYWDFPRIAIAAEARGDVFAMESAFAAQTGLAVRIGERILTHKHGVTRFRITLDCFEAMLKPRGKSGPERVAQWVDPEGLTELPLHVTARKLAVKLLECGRGVDRRRGRSAVGP
jgi:A/G-specific adenine glycosylase